MGNRIGNNLVHTGENQELVAALVAQSVSFVIVGGLAISWHSAERTADDLDILVDNSQHNDQSISAALVQLGFDCPPSGSFLSLGIQMPLKRRFYADILTPRSGAPSFLECYEDSVPALLFNIPVRVASIPTLIALKQFAAAQSRDSHAKHMADIEILHRAAA